MTVLNNSPLYDPDFDAPKEQTDIAQGGQGGNDLLQVIPPQKLFALGVLTAFLVLCTIGFFVLLGVVL